MQARKSLPIPTRGRGTYDITRGVNDTVRAMGIAEGLCNVFVHHTRRVSITVMSE